MHAPHSVGGCLLLTSADLDQALPMLPVFAALERQDLWAGQLFGMGEGFFALSSLTAPREAPLTTVGTPISPLDEFRVLDPASEREVADGEVGELACRGPYTLRGTSTPRR